MKKFLPTLMLAMVLTGMLAATSIRPAQADQAAVRRNILIGAAALVTGIAIETNVAHKRRLANTVQGYLPDGSTVYQDGHVVLTNGQTYYPGNYGQTIACNSGSCYLSGGQNYNGYNGYNGYNSYQPYNNPPNQPYGGYNPSVYNNYNPGDVNNDDHNQTAYANTYSQNGVRYYGRRRHRNH